jgi:hypothetical protein
MGRLRPPLAQTGSADGAVRSDCVLLCVVALFALAPAGYFISRHTNSKDSRLSVVLAVSQSTHQGSVPSCSAPGGTFSTGFGASGNDPAAPNMMGRRGVMRKEAEAFVSAGANTAVVPCPFGDVLQVGPKGAVRFLCGLHLLPPDAPLFSFGSNGDFRFEDAVRRAAPNIPVVVFDPTMSQESMSRRQRGSLELALRHAAVRNYSFVGTGIGPRKGFLEMQTIKKKRLFCASVDTLPSLLNATQWDDIGILKIDASGEFEILAHLEASGFNLAAKVSDGAIPVPSSAVANTLCLQGTTDSLRKAQYLLPCRVLSISSTQSFAHRAAWCLLTKIMCANFDQSLHRACHWPHPPTRSPTHPPTYIFATMSIALLPRARSQQGWHPASRSPPVSPSGGRVRLQLLLRTRRSRCADAMGSQPRVCPHRTRARRSMLRRVFVCQHALPEVSSCVKQTTQVTPQSVSALQGVCIKRQCHRYYITPHTHVVFLSRLACATGGMTHSTYYRVNSRHAHSLQFTPDAWLC